MATLVVVVAVVTSVAAGAVGGGARPVPITVVAPGTGDIVAYCHPQKNVKNKIFNEHDERVS